MINYNGLTKAEVLVALYNYAKFTDFETYMFADLNDLTVDRAEALLKKSKKIGVLDGRIINVDLTGDTGFTEDLFDKFNGVGRAKELVDRYFEQKMNSSHTL